MLNITEPVIEDVSVVKPVSFGPANYVLLVLSAGIGLGLLVGFIILYYREVRRKLEAKENLRKQRLNMRRKGISGMSSTYLQNSRIELLEAESEFEKTSYLEISETPTSVRVSLHGTPSSASYRT
ncbi:hypothetical protein CHS0354_018628 [Potamilus streckersoni]|uniref:Uncharacterized protein n=1 Tax=Potamilus streckersoni TaxID=2493646 RepID=A0AAE0SKR6_9BIVA|nr:hypothetical protein CHS0354_018628 [Potamilus streckersoni]